MTDQERILARLDVLQERMEAKFYKLEASTGELMIKQAVDRQELENQGKRLSLQTKVMFGVLAVLSGAGALTSDSIIEMVTMVK